MTDISVEQIAQWAVSALEDVKAKDIVMLDTTESTPLFSRLIVATGESTRQVRALVRHVEAQWKQNGVNIIGVEGADEGRWALVDCGDVVVHTMLPDVREFYDLETLWKGAHLSRLDS